jgi:hypothetical protein
MKLKVASMPTFADFTVEILADESQYLRGQILKWMSYIYDPGTMEAGTLGDVNNTYKRDNVKAYQLDRLGNPVMMYNFYGLFPVNCGQPTFQHEPGEPQKFQVTFTYDFYRCHIMKDGKDPSVELDASNKNAALSSAREKIEVNPNAPAQAINKPKA